MDDKRVKLFSEEHRRNISKALTGKKLSKEHRKALSNAKKGKKLSIETRKKMSIAQKKRTRTKQEIERFLEDGKKTRWHEGQVPVNKGKKHSSESIKKIKAKRALQTEPSNWKGGITPLARRIRNSKSYVQWRMSVFERDDYVCENCGARGGKLEAHHNVRFSHLLQQYKITTFKQAMNCGALWDLGNGKTLCKTYHRSGTCNQI